MNALEAIGGRSSSIYAHHDLRFFRGMLAALVASVVLLTTGQTADARKIGPTFQVNSYTSDVQFQPSVAGLNDGGFVVVWTSDKQDGDDYGIFGQRYASSGRRLGREFRVNTTIADRQWKPAVAALADGGFVVTWETRTTSSVGIYAQRYDSAGKRAGRQVRVSGRTATDRHDAAVTGLDVGGFVVAWFEQLLNGREVILAQLFGGDGTSIGGQFYVTTVFNPGLPKLAGVKDGRFVAVWEAEPNGDLGIRGQRFDATGKPTESAFEVETNTPHEQITPSVAPLTGGGFIATWQSNAGNGLWTGAFAQRYDALGGRVGMEFEANTSSRMSSVERKPVVAGLNDGGFVVLYQVNILDNNANGHWETYGQQYDSAGRPVHAEFQVTIYPDNSGRDPSVAALAGGGFVAVWNGCQSSVCAIFGQRFSP